MDNVLKLEVDCIEQEEMLDFTPATAKMENTNMSTESSSQGASTHCDYMQTNFKSENSRENCTSMEIPHGTCARGSDKTSYHRPNTDYAPGFINVKVEPSTESGGIPFRDTSTHGDFMPTITRVETLYEDMSVCQKEKYIGHQTGKDAPTASDEVCSAQTPTEETVTATVKLEPTNEYDDFPSQGPFTQGGIGNFTGHRPSASDHFDESTPDTSRPSCTEALFEARKPTSDSSTIDNRTDSLARQDLSSIKRCHLLQNMYRECDSEQQPCKESCSDWAQHAEGQPGNASDDRDHSLDTAAENLNNAVDDSVDSNVDADEFQTHNVQVKQGKVHKCLICEKIFNCASNLRRHKFTHTGEKPHVCKVCGQSFSLGGNLRKHALTHTGEKPFKCSTCGQCFSQSIHLKAHTWIHTGDKPYKCVTCGKGFTRASDVKRHNISHTGEKPHKCLICGKGFGFLCSLKTHVTGQHMLKGSRDPDSGETIVKRETC